MSNPEENPVLVDIDNGVMTITINRPHAKNAIDAATAKAIAAALIKLDNDDAIQVAILTGAGGGFCSGMDLKAFLRGELPIVEGRGLAGLTEATVKKPLIAAVEGFALAGGFEIMVACDLIVVSESARIGIPEVKRGLIAAGGGLLRMPHQMPPRLAMEMAITGDPISAQRAYDVGLVNQVVSDGSALEQAKKMAARITGNGPMAVIMSKFVVTQARDWSQEEMFTKQLEHALPVLQSNDAKEGSLAFAEKRAPKWTGS